MTAYVTCLSRSTVTHNVFFLAIPYYLLSDELITRPEESYRLWCVVVRDLENFVNEEARAHWGLLRQKKKKKDLSTAASGLHEKAALSRDYMALSNVIDVYTSYIRSEHAGNHRSVDDL